MSLGSQLKDLRTSRKLTLDEMAIELNKKYKNTNFSKGRLSRWENDKDEPRLSNLKMIANYFNKSLDYFFPDSHDVPSNIYPISGKIVNVPIIGSIAMGTPITAEQNIIGYTSEQFDDLPHEEVFALECVGHSMEPTIPDGAIAIFEKTSQVEDGEIAAVLVDNDEEATLKRIQHSGDKILLKPDNPDYQTLVLDKDHPGRIIGKLYEYKVRAHRN